MRTKSFSVLRSSVIDCLKTIFDTENGKAGWGTCLNRPVSIVNTAEALCTFNELDSIDDQFINTNRDKIITYLTNTLDHYIKNKEVPTRYISHGLLALHLLNYNELEEQLLERLLSLSIKSGGWPSKGTLNEALLLPTYQAILVLRKIGINIDDKHLNFLTTLKKADNLCSFHISDFNSNFGASCLVLFLLSIGSFSEKSVTHEIADALSKKIPEIFNQMLKGDNWVSQDTKGIFRIYGYGHGLLALHFLGYDLLSLDIDKFLIVCSEKKGAEFSLDPHQTWVPAMLELSLAFKAIHLNYDPLKYYTTNKQMFTLNANSQIEIDKANIIKQNEQLNIRQLVFDEWEKDLICQRIELQNLSKQINTQVSNSISDELNSYFNKQLLKFKKSLIYYFFLVSIFLFGIISTILRIQKGQFKWGNFESILLILVALIPLVIELIRWNRST